MEKRDTSLINDIIIGRVEPHIYAFTTETIPNYLKVGDTYRPVSERIEEWRKKYEKLKHIYTESARIDDNTIFRDYSVHQFLEIEKSRKRLTREDVLMLSQSLNSQKRIYFSNEFFENAEISDIDEAIEDIKKSAKNNDGKYNFLTSDHLPKDYKYIRNVKPETRKLQQDVVDAFMKAYHANRKNLLMYAVMRFGKTYTSLLCAQAMNANLILIVSGKVNVNNEWKRTVQSIIGFEDFEYITKKNLKSSKTCIRDLVKSGKKPVLFLSLQDLQGDKKKKAHNEVFSNIWDLVIVDETHFGAWAIHYGKVLLEKADAAKHKEDDDEKLYRKELKRQIEGIDKLDDLEKGIKDLKRNITLHLSGTPYRILMENKIKKEDIIACVQQSDIIKAQQEWVDNNKYNENIAEWENPYYGFPQLIRFAFNPNEASFERIKELKAKGASDSFSELFRPKSIVKKDESLSHQQFIHEDVVLDFLKVIDGAKNDSNVLGFLDNERIKSGKLCRHIVMVLPYCASCDALENLINTHRSNFKNLGDYDLINISGFNRKKKFDEPENVINFIANSEAKGKKTITLTVNRMLTGSTVPYWDTMLFLKESSSAEEYDQAVFRLQNPFIDEYVVNDSENPENIGKKDRIVKFNMKPQTILIDFDPDRMFRLQERKCLIYNINKERIGNNLLKKRIEDELAISPIIVLDHNKLREISSTDIMDAVREYSSTRSIVEEANDIPVDMDLLDNLNLNKVIQSLTPSNAKKGINSKANKTKKGNKGNDIDSRIQGVGSDFGDSGLPGHSEKGSDDVKTLGKKISALYTLVLFFAYLTNDRVCGLQDIIDVIDKSEDNIRIAGSLNLNKEILDQLQRSLKGGILCILDRKIHNTNDLINDSQKTPRERIELSLTKFTRLSETEIVTPAWVADDMVKLLPYDLAEKGNILDIASKQGEFAFALYRRFGNNIADRIYSICTSPIAYEFTRKLYTLLSLPINNIIMDFHSIDIINESKHQVTNFFNNVSFEAIVGNPPYNENKIDTSDNPIYHLFMDFAYSNCEFVSMITPARYLFNAGKTPEVWNNKILKDQHFKVATYEPESMNIFDNVDIKGGLSISIYDKKSDFGGADNFRVNSLIGSIVDKVRSNSKNFVSEIIMSPESYKFSKELHTDYPAAINKLGQGHRYDITTNIFKKIPLLFYDTNDEHESRIGIHGRINNKRRLLYINSNYIAPHPNLNKWKVILPKSNGMGAFGETLSSPFIGCPLTGHTQTFISIGAFETEYEANSVIKYLKSKFLRALLSSLKVTQDNKKRTWANVPMQNFTEKSDIDWSKSVEEIDEDLFNKYDLSPAERDFIKKNVKEM